MTDEEKLEWAAFEYSRICDQYRMMDLVRRAFIDGAHWAHHNHYNPSKEAVS